MAPFWFLIYQPLGLSLPTPLIGAHFEVVGIGYTGHESQQISPKIGFQKQSIGYTGPEAQEVI